MAFFSELKSRSRVMSLTPQQAIGVVALISLQASAEEIGAFDDQADVVIAAAMTLGLMTHTLPIFSNSHDNFHEEIQNLTGKLKEECTLDEIISIVKSSLSPSLRETALALACDVILSDGFVSDTEEAFLSYLADDLDVSEESKEIIMKAAMIRMRTV